MSNDFSKKLEPTRVARAPTETLSYKARQFIAASKSANTRRAYQAQLAQWAIHRHGLSDGISEKPKAPDKLEEWLRASLPATEIAVANWLAERATAGQAHATLRTAVAAMRAAHHAMGQSFDTGHPAIVQSLQGIARENARVQRQAAPIRVSDMLDIINGLTAAPIDIRDGGLLALGYVFGLRRSELAALDLDKQGKGDGFVHISARSIDLVLVRSKTAKAGVPETVTVPRHAVATAVAAIERWIAVAKIAPGTPILRSVTKGGAISVEALNPQSISGIIKSRIAEHYQRRGVPRETALAYATKYSGHSLRVGFAVTAAEGGASADEIALITRHTDLRMPRRYSIRADQVRRSPFNRPGVGTDAAAGLHR